jgi:hypothetical protein
VHLDDDAVGALALLAHFDPAGEGHVPRRLGQHRMGNPRALHRGSRKAGCERRSAEQKREGDGPLARQHRTNDKPRQHGKHRCQRRLAVGGKIDDDAGAERDRQPWHQPAGPDFGDRPLTELFGDASGKPRQPDRPKNFPPAPRRRIPGCRPFARPAPRCHRRPNRCAVAPADFVAVQARSAKHSGHCGPARGPAKIEPGINTSTAKTIRLDVPATRLAHADEEIE